MRQFKLLILILGIICMLTYINAYSNNQFNIYAPLKSEYYILEYIKSLFHLNSLSYFNKKINIEHNQCF